MEQISNLLPAVFAAIGLIAAHYFPWRQLFGRKLPRLAAYSIGTGVMATSFTIWLWCHEMYQAIVILWAVIIASGAAVCLCWWLDAWLENRAAARENRRQVELLERQREQERL